MYALSMRACVYVSCVYVRVCVSCVRVCVYVCMYVRLCVCVASACISVG